MQVHTIIDKDSKDFDVRSNAVWENAEVFDVKTERLFRYLQVRYLIQAHPVITNIQLILSLLIFSSSCHY